MKDIPNPASDEVIIEMPEIEENFSVTILDLHSREVFRQSAFRKRDAEDVFDFPEGVNILKGTIVESYSVQKKLVKAE